MNHSKSSTTRRGTRQSYLLLAVGIAVALALPYLLQPHAGAFSAASHDVPR